MKKLPACCLILFLSMASLAQKEGFVNNGNAKIHYRVFGKGKPLLIINGGPGMNSDGFAGLAGLLSKNCKAIIYDQRGTGQSLVEKPDSSTITMKLMTEDIEALRQHLKIDRWIILGHSFGGMLASYYATLYPDKIQAIILSSSGGIDLDLLSYVSANLNANLNQKEQDSVKYWTKKIGDGDTTYYAKLQRGTYLASAYVYDKKNIPAIAKRLTQSNPQINVLVWQDLQKINFDCGPGLASFNKPVLIIQGRQDIVAEKTALKAHEALKNSEVVFIDRCIHYGWLDRPDEYLERVKKFIALN